MSCRLERKALETCLWACELTASRAHWGEGGLRRP